MKQQTFDKATEYIDAIAAKLGVAAEHVYGVLVRQQVAEGVADLILGSVFLALFISLLVLLYKILVRAEYEEGRWGSTPSNVYAKIRDTIEDTDGILYFAFAIALVVLVVVATINLYFGALSVINPEYYAIKELLDTIGGGK